MEIGLDEFPVWAAEHAVVYSTTRAAQTTKQMIDNLSAINTYCVCLDVVPSAYSWHYPLRNGTITVITVTHGVCLAFAAQYGQHSYDWWWLANIAFLQQRRNNSDVTNVLYIVIKAIYIYNTILICYKINIISVNLNVDTPTQVDE